MDSEGQSVGMDAEGSGRDSSGDERVVDPWQVEAAKKNLPEQFVEDLEASDGVTEKEKARIVRSFDTAADLNEKRRKAVERGRLLGENEARSRRETGSFRDQRIKRAMAYAAWEFDGKPQSSERQRREFGVDSPQVTPSLERLLLPRSDKK